jgi:hypothetical protein
MGDYEKGFFRRLKRRCLHEGELLSDRYREYREDREDEPEVEKEQPERHEKSEHDEASDWERRCKETLDEVEAQSKNETDDWEARCNKALDEVEDQAEHSERKRDDSAESKEEKEFSDWDEKCKRALDEVESEVRKNEPEEPDKDEIDEARDRLHDEFVNDMEKKLDKEDKNESKVDEATESSYYNKSTKAETYEGDTSSSQSGEGTVSNLAMERKSEDAQEERDDPESEKNIDNETQEPPNEDTESEKSSPREPKEKELNEGETEPQNEDESKKHPTNESDLEKKESEKNTHPNQEQKEIKDPETDEVSDSNEAQKVDHKLSEDEVEKKKSEPTDPNEETCESQQQKKQEYKEEVDDSIESPKKQSRLESNTDTKVEEPSRETQEKEPLEREIEKSNPETADSEKHQEQSERQTSEIEKPLKSETKDEEKQVEDSSETHEEKIEKRKHQSESHDEIENRELSKEIDEEENKKTNLEKDEKVVDEKSKDDEKSKEEASSWSGMFPPLKEGEWAFGGMFPEEDEKKRIRRWLAEEYKKLPEEEKEHFRELYKPKLESEEELEEWLEKFSEMKKQVDADMHIEYVREWIRAKQELKERGIDRIPTDTELDELEETTQIKRKKLERWFKDGKVPRSAHEIRERELECAWASIIYDIQIRCWLEEKFKVLSEEEKERFRELFRLALDSEEEFEELLERHHELKEIPDAESSERDSFIQRFSSKHSFSHESISNRGKRIEYEFTKDFPSIKDKKITNAEELWEFVERYHPSLMQRNDFQSLFQYAEIYLRLITDFHEYDVINSSDISKVSKETGLSKTTIREWLTTDSMPRLFYLILTRESLEDSCQKQIPDFQEYLTKMGRLCNGLDSIDSLLKRIDTLYINEIAASQKNWKQTEEFFEIIQAIKKGAKSYGQIEEMTGIKEERVLRRIRSPLIPRFVGMVSCIPEEPPSSGKKWLPLRITGSRMKDFIQVPEKIKKPEEILDVLIQLRNFTSSVEKEDSNPEFSDFGGIIAFMYFLGLTISDGNFDSSKKTVSSSERVKLKLSKKYGWSETAGSAYCQTLNELGFKTVKGKDAYSSYSDILLHVWRSEKSPFFVWIRQELLGLRESRNKNENRVQPNWVLNAPKSWRISILQGIADGDGFATTKGLYAAIATYTNQEFVSNLMKSLDIDSYMTDIAVCIRCIDDIKKAAKLPMFRFAEGRQRRLEELVPMLESMDWSRISEDEESSILEFHRQGMKIGEITEKLWEKYGRVHRRNTIYNIIERNVSTSNSECTKQ